MRRRHNAFINRQDVIVIMVEDSNGRKTMKLVASLSDAKAVASIFKTVIDKYGLDISVKKKDEQPETLWWVTIYKSEFTCKCMSKNIKVPAIINKKNGQIGTYFKKKSFMNVLNAKEKKAFLDKSFKKNIILEFKRLEW